MCVSFSPPLHLLVTLILAAHLFYQKQKHKKGELTRRRPINVALASMSRKKAGTERERERGHTHHVDLNVKHIVPLQVTH